MFPQEPDDWPEHAVCARCGSPLGPDFRESPLGLRFCPECFGGTIQEKARERAAELYLRGRCSNCGGSLINGYRMSKLGVLYCVPCYERRLSEVPAPEGPGEPEAGHTEAAVVERFPATLLFLTLSISHLLFFLHVVFQGVGLLVHADLYLKALIILDLLTVILFLGGRHIGSRLANIWALLIAMGFIILVLRELSSRAG
ncbi:MAG: hypothetical protein Kow0099_05010 [Candidatus Abyssubacteria bacterium]